MKFSDFNNNNPRALRWNNERRLKYFKAMQSAIKNDSSSDPSAVLVRSFNYLSRAKKIVILGQIIAAKDESLSTEDIAAIIGNMIQESTLDPTIINPYSGAFGLVQWLSGNRVDGLLDYAEDRNPGHIASAADPVTQVDWLWLENEQVVNWLPKVKEGATLSEKTWAFLKWAEGVAGSSSEHFSYRLKYAKEALKVLQSNG